MSGVIKWPLAAFCLLLSFSTAHSESLTPPYFNLAEGKNISASATCGDSGAELFCKLIGAANSETDLNQANVIQGQYCDYCDPSRPDKWHPPEHAVDGMETWWQSPPLSRSMKYNEVNLTIELGQEFHVAYVFIKMANSPRPGLWVLEKSADYGKTYTPWQYFSDSLADCETYFGKETLQPISRDDSVICTTEYSKIVPLEGGEIPISLLNKRPSSNHYFNSTVLQEWTRATNVRFRFLRTKNLLGHLMSVARQDPTVTRRYFYSIKDISIGGRCMCNGHAQTCDIPDSNDNRVLLCNCRHGTCGPKCERCCTGFEQKAWRQSRHDRPFSCEPCNCFNHSNECQYDPDVDKKRLSLDTHGKYDGGGVCQNCQHNTEGINCNKCKDGYFRPYQKQWNETDVCQPCVCDTSFHTGRCAEGSGRCECRTEFEPPNCDRCSFGHHGYPNCRPCECFLNGTLSLQCAPTDGNCSCLPSYTGPHCRECSEGYYGFPECKTCECDSSGSISESCEQESGNCSCKANFAGKQCNECKDGYFSYPECTYCSCDTSGTEPAICDKSTGKCLCKEGYSGDRCDRCQPGYYGYPNCIPCNCGKNGSLSNTCSATGKCSCLGNYAGRTCEQCSPGFYSYPDCQPCECDYHGSIGISCDNEGKCECKENFAGQTCNNCKEGYYNFPACEDCNCHPAGVVAGFAGCGSVPAGELCKCKERVEGRICDKCKPLFWNLNPNNPDGCEECKCNKTGVLGGIAVCDTNDGQCVCKPSVVTRGCSECEDGTYNLEEGNLFGCTDCGCDVGGSINNICNKKTGQCSCQSRVDGRTCKEPLKAHYFPTLYQYQYEIEDGKTPEFTRVRYAHDENIFKNYSWKGYAVFSVVQKEVLQDIHISKPSLYIMVYRFVNNNPHNIVGSIKITPDNPGDNEQSFKIQFKNTSEPAFVRSTPFVMNPGKWQISIKANVDTNENFLLDYFVLLPEDFYIPTILDRKVEKPCVVDDLELCRHHTYPNITTFDKTFGVGGYIQKGMKTEQLKEYFQDTEHLDKIQVYNRVPLINENQPNITFNLSVSKPGPYVLIINYITPLDDARTHTLEAILHTKNGNRNGNVVLYSCPYSTKCRQVVKNEIDGIGVYEFDNNSMVIDLRGNEANVGIHSIYAIPLEEWSINYIKPTPLCIRKNGTCIKGSFYTPAETKTIQFSEEIKGELGKYKPPIIDELNNSSYVWLNPKQDAIDIRGKVPETGIYSFVLHYYQPDYPEFDLDVIIQNGQFYEAKIPIKFCPSISGCRSLIVEDGRNNQFSLLENFMITLKQPEGKNVYLDYLLIIPADLYHEKTLEEENLVRLADEFVRTCGSDHFNADTSQLGFCRDSVFSVTAAHNGGALPCLCDYHGSTSFECDKYGGQCRCRDHIIGRQCTACRTGFYGFPDCKPCNCPSTAYCDPTNGQCICPQHVTGEKCDQCEPLTYGYDPMNGCEECKCHPQGVNGTYQCDLQTGVCPCKNHIVGRTCDACEAGFYAFPYCDNCDCDLRGSTADICDAVTAACFCKENVVGPQCTFCKEGSFNLQSSNEQGCTECFCFGKTIRCNSAQLINSPLLEMSNWTVVGINTTSRDLNITLLDLEVENVESDGIIGVDFTDFNVDEIIGYFSAPEDYLGKKLKSYGGFLNYSIYYVVGATGSAVGGPDVILQGSNTFLTYSSFEQPPPNIQYSSTLQLVESNFELPSGTAARREHLMEVLKDLRGVYLRANYWSDSVTTRLMNVVMEEGIDFVDFRERYSTNVDYKPPILTSVEQCMCPPNYQGLSCEECAPGYYRIQSGPHGGYCVPCECNGHATECDVNTGLCFNCTHNTRGDHCEMCEVGYHGNALAGTSRDCLICACPLPITSNNFATSCDVSSDGEKISCECSDGYVGARCQSCAPGFYGRPEVPDDYCKPCQCSGNINPEDPSSCDTVTGKCLRCLNNTFGEACSLCAPGYFGDAITLKDCQACICDLSGTDRCDSYTGRCVCKPNVVGEKCDRCQIEHYGFQSGLGCKACECGEASESDQCEDSTGQCRCKPGVGGRACDRCAAGYWNYTADGCVSCGCKSEYSLGFGCNPLTGQCECLKGVTGEKCDHCPSRWAFVPEIGCHACDDCVHPLLDDTDSLAAMIDPLILEFDSTQSGYFTRRKLDNMREQLEKLKPKFSEVDPKQEILEEQIAELASLEQDSKNVNRKSNYSLENSDLLRNQSENLKDRAEILLYELMEAEKDSERIFEEIDKITGELSEEAGNEVDKAVQEGQTILDLMKIYNLTDRETEAENQLIKVNELLNNVTDYKVPVDVLLVEIDDLKKGLKVFNNKLDDLDNHTQYSLNMASEAEKIIAKSSKDKLKSKLDSIENQIETSKTNLNKSEELLKNASKLIDTAIGTLKILQDAPDKLEDRNAEFEAKLEANDEDIQKIRELKPKVQEHAQNLSRRVEELQAILSEPQIGSNDAIKAARAYKDIIEAVNSARNAADTAKNDTNHASDILNNIQDKTYDSDSNSSKNLDDAHALNKKTLEDLRPKLLRALESYKPVKELHDNNEDMLKKVETILDKIPIEPLSTAYRNASKNAENANSFTKVVEEVVNNTFTELPKQKEQARTLPKDLDDMRRNLNQTDKHIITVNEQLPKVIDKLDKIPSEQQQMSKISDDIKSKINKLNQQIELARDIANRIKVGAKFYPNTTLELRNPANIEDLTTSTKFSGYFRTDKQNGLIMYLGNPNGTNLRKTKSDDYMALVVQNGYPVLKLDIGNGPESVVNKKYVADNNWYQFIVERVGHNAKLTIREELPGNIENVITEEKSLSGPYTIFNLDKDKSKLFVGSFPPHYESQKDLDGITFFEGEIEDLVIGNTPVSLWNFNDGYENNHGAKERNKLVVLQRSTGYRFNGHGYVIMDAKSLQLRSKSTIQLSFRTFATEGLILFAGKETTFIALELRNGKVLYQYNLGSGTKKFATSRSYNDGNWHKIEATRDGHRGALRIDNEDILDRTNQISGTSLEPIDTISFGGYPHAISFKDVTGIKFDGCINNVTITSEPLDLRNNIKEYDVIPGCPDKFAPMVSFEKSRPGYVGWDRLVVNNDFKASLKFKTKEKDGLIFYATDFDQSNGISLALVDGHLKVISQKTPLVSKDTFNDSEWHVVSVIHNDEMLRVDFDDYGFQVDEAPKSIHTLYAHLYVGGVPRKLTPLPGTVGSEVPFHGCIADLTVNGNVKNFANTTDRSMEILDKCILDESYVPLDPDVHGIPTLPPEPSIIQVITTTPAVETEAPIVISAGRGDSPDIVVNTRAPGTVPPPVDKPKVEKCALPVEPATEDFRSSGYKFGTQKESRIEHNTPRGHLRKAFDFSLEIKTSNPDGIIFYVSDNKSHSHYSALYVQNGHLVFTFKGDGDAVVIRTTESYNDDSWHLVEFSRSGGDGKLVVDGDSLQGISEERMPSLNLKPPFYFGGLRPDDYEAVQKNLNTAEYYNGCIRNLLMNNKPLENPQEIGIIPCSDNIEAGTFFGGGTNTYVRLKERFKVGVMFMLKMEIKPRKVSGLLIAAHGKRDYLVLEMVDGDLRLTVESGKGKVVAIYSPGSSNSSKYTLCDGNWHQIEAVKSSNVVSLSVDSVFMDPKIGDHHASSTDTGSALFLGGHRLLKKVRGITVRSPFVGCVRNVQINNEPVEIIPSMAEGKINVGTCRTD